MTPDEQLPPHWAMAAGFLLVALIVAGVAGVAAHIVAWLL